MKATCCWIVGFKYSLVLELDHWTNACHSSGGICTMCSFSYFEQYLKMRLDLGELVLKQISALHVTFTSGQFWPRCLGASVEDYVPMNRDISPVHIFSPFLALRVISCRDFFKQGCNFWKLIESKSTLFCVYLNSQVLQLPLHVGGSWTCNYDMHVWLKKYVELLLLQQCVEDVN